MSDFIFKIPELPEDALLKRRKTDVAREKCSDNYRYPLCSESGNTSLMGLMNKSRTGDFFPLRSLRENIEEDLTKPSTSKFVNHNRDNIFQSSFASLENQNDYNMNLNTRSNCFLDTRRRGNDFNYSFNNINQHDMPHTIFTNRVSKCSSNLSSISVNNPHPVLNQNFRNSSAKFNNLYGRNQCDHFDHPKYFNVKNIEPCSSTSVGKSVFSSGLLPEKGGVKNISVNKSMNKVSTNFSTYETLNGTGIIQKDSMNPLNLSHSVLENQAVMKSVLQTSVFSMKEQIMNTLENFGQKLLRNTPEMEGSFFKVAKDIKSIFENSSIFMNQTMSTLALNCTSDGIDFRLQNMLQCQYQNHGPSKKPCNILKEIQSGQNEIHKVEFLKSFTVEEKKLRNSHKDLLDEKLNFDPPPSKIIKSKEVNLRNWYPVALEEGLAFSGLNDENNEFKTETMKKRINNRKILLTNGSICNLIGRGNPEKKFPSDISKKLKNGIDVRWKILKDKIAQFQKESQEHMEITSSDVSSGHLKNSLRTSRRKNGTNIVNVCKINDRETCGESDFTSPKSSKTKIRSKQNVINQNKKRKIDSIIKEKVFESDKTPCLTLKKDESYGEENAKVKNNDDNSSRVIHVTRSGRAVKRPGNLWSGGNFNSKNMESESELNASIKTQIISVPSEGNEKGSTSHLKRKRVISDKAAIETKKNKSEQSKNEELQTNKTVSKGRERIKKTRDNSEPKLVNSTINTKSKNSKNKGRKKHTTSLQKSENTDSWVNDFDDGLINISELPTEELNADIKKMKLISMETPPLKILRSHLKILRSCTPVPQSPYWLLSQHTESEVKKFEKLRAQTFNKKIPKEKVTKSSRKIKIPAHNKDVDAVVNWISEKEVKSPKKCSKVIKYVIPKRSELEDEDEMEDWENDKQI